MTGEIITRREFLKLLTFSILGASIPSLDLPDPAGYELGRVTVSSIDIYQEPSYRSRNVGQANRDDLLMLLEKITSDEGPAYNPSWYRLSCGYAHSGNIQVVCWQPQTPMRRIPESGVLVEVSIPYTRTFRKPDPYANPIYRLYYKSTAWVKTVLEGADGRIWYGLLDDIFGMQYYARAEHFRRIPDEELAPISPELPWSEKRIEIDLASQELRALESGLLVFQSKISSGIPYGSPGPNGIPTITPSGRFNVSKKMPLRHMGNGILTSDLEAYELPGVPWVSFFHLTGVAMHGTYWHSDFGRPRSHGCVNMRTEDAQWIYRWSLPFVPTEEIMVDGYGTPVVVE